MAKQLTSKYTIYEVVRVGNDLDLIPIKSNDILDYIPSVMFKTFEDKVPRRVKRLSKLHNIPIDVMLEGNGTAIVGWRSWSESQFNEWLGVDVEFSMFEVIIKENRKVRGL